jgi:spermidine synthase
MLNVIVFLCGAALMSLEIVAARVLAPALGNSIFVWGSVISTVMIALSLGYWLGGHAADRFGARRVLAPVIAGAGLLTVLAPLVSAGTLQWAAGMGPRLGSLTASALIFFAPALLLAMVSPLGISLAAGRGMEHIGRSAGGLYAVSTAGSIVGTLATAFWLIPLMSLEPLIVWTGFLLLATALAAFALGRPDRRGTLVTTVLVVVALAVGGWVLWRVAPAPAVDSFGETVLFRADTQYHRITVTEDATQRHLRFDNTHQSAMNLKDGYTSSILYPDYLHLAIALKPDAKRVLVLGMGGGTVTKRFWRDYPGVRVDTVEIDPMVIDVAKRFFQYPTDARLRTFNEDARRYVQSTNERYDIIIVDCYYADAIPSHLVTDEFFRECKAKMTPDGVLAYNVIGSVQGDSSKLFRSLYRTADGVWSRLYVFPVGIAQDHSLTTRRNIIVLATDSGVTKDLLLRRIASRVDGRVTVTGFPTFGADLYGGVIAMGDVPKLTDGYAPTDSLIPTN